MSAMACLGIRLSRNWQQRKLMADMTRQLRSELAPESLGPDKQTRKQLASAEYRQNG